MDQKEIENKEFIIKTGDKEFPASEYQVEIFKEIKKGINNLIINASAGSSKTSTIVNSIRFIPEKKKILFVAFNKDIVEKIKEEIDHENTNVSTFHSLGYQILLENFSVKKSPISRSLEYLDNKIKNIDIYKYSNYISNNINNISRFPETRNLVEGKKNIYFNNIKSLVDYSRYYLAFTIKEISRIADIYGIIPIADEFNVVRDVLLWGKENLETIDYTDMIWLPNVLNLVTKKNLYDWIFIDEAQDTSIAEQGLVEKCFKRGTKFVAVGDDFQKINVWAGSTEEAIDLFKKHQNTIVKRLPICYRCPKKIVDLAKKYSDNIIVFEQAIEGEIKYNVSELEPKSRDMVLCRTTAPLLELYLNYLKNNKKAYIRGSENIKDKLNSLIISTKCILIDRNCVTKDGLIPKLYTELFEEMEKLKSVGLSEDEILSHPSILNLYDTIKAIVVVSEGGIFTVEELKNKIKEIFSNTDDDGIMLTTVHKAKGLEADNVFIYYPSLMPLRLAKKDWEIQSESNLIYVAYTRAKKTLNFIKEDKYNKYSVGYSSSEKLKETLNEIKRKIDYSNELGVTEKNYENKVENKPIIKLGSTANTTTEKISSGKKQKAGLKMKNLL